MADDEYNHLYIQLQDFKYAKTKSEVMLRFTLTWKIDCDLGVIGMYHEGCRIRRLLSGEYEFYLPQHAGFGGNYRSYTKMTEDLHDAVLKAIKDGYPQWLEKVGLLRKSTTVYLPPEDLYPSMADAPKLITVGGGDSK